MNCTGWKLPFRENQLETTRSERVTQKELRKKAERQTAGGVISYDTGAGQRVAVAAGMTSPIWPTAKVTAKVVILGR